MPPLPSRYPCCYHRSLFCATTLVELDFVTLWAGLIHERLFHAPEKQRWIHRVVEPILLVCLPVHLLNPLPALLQHALVLPVRWGALLNKVVVFELLDRRPLLLDPLHLLERAQHLLVLI